MTVVSKTIKVDPHRVTDIQPNGPNGLRITALVTENDLGVKFVSDDGNETNIMLTGNADLDTNILLDENNYLVLEPTDNSSHTAFLSMETT